LFKINSGDNSPEYVIKMKKKSLLESLKAAGIVVAIIAILIIFFSLQVIIQGVGEGVKNSISGEAVYIGGGNESEDKNESKEYFGGEVLCWIESGLTEQDLIVAGNLLKDFKCPSANKANVNARYEDNCIVVDINGEADTKLCSRRTKPVIIIRLESSKDLPFGVFPEDFEIPEKNYYWYVLFFLIIFVVVIFWAQYERSVKTDIEIKVERDKLMREREEREEKKKYLKSVKLDKKDDVVHVMPAPAYDERKAKKKEREQKKIENKVKKDQKEKLKGSLEKKNELIIKFNRLSEETNKSIISGKLIESRKRYFELFDIYSKLILLVNKNNRVSLNNAMEYLCNYLGVLEKIKGTKRSGLEQKSKEVKKEKTIRPKPKVVDMSQLEEMKDLLKQKQYDLAKRMFYGGDVEHFDQKDTNMVVKNRKDKLEEIELRHDKLLEKGVVKVDQDDFYKFMYDLTLLRKELRNRGKSKGNKKKG
jgi:hypothetical protein